MLTSLRLPLFALALTAVMPLHAAMAVTGKPYGTWSMGKVTVKLSDCGGKLCGNIVGLKEPISKIDGKPKVDRENPDASKRKRRLIGLSILIGMRPAGLNKWKGTIYNPDDGKSYSATVSLEGNRMKVRGCVAAILCKSNNFVRVN